MNTLIKLIHFYTLTLQIGAEIHGKVDGAFDSGYLMTAMVNGKVFRGVLFAPVSLQAHIIC